MADQIRGLVRPNWFGFIKFASAVNGHSGCPNSLLGSDNQTIPNQT